MKSMLMIHGAAVMLLARAGEEAGVGSTDGLAKQLQEDADKQTATDFHEHVYRALVSGTSDEDLRAAIESAKDKLKARWEEQADADNPWPGIEVFEEHELLAANFRAMLEGKGNDSIFDIDEDDED